MKDIIQWRKGAHDPTHTPAPARWQHTHTRTYSTSSGWVLGGKAIYFQDGRNRDNPKIIFILNASRLWAMRHIYSSSALAFSLVLITSRLGLWNYNGYLLCVDKRLTGEPAAAEAEAAKAPLLQPEEKCQQFLTSACRRSIHFLWRILHLVECACGVCGARQFFHRSFSLPQLNPFECGYNLCELRKRFVCIKLKYILRWSGSCDGNMPMLICAVVHYIKSKTNYCAELSVQLKFIHFSVHIFHSIFRSGLHTEPPVSEWWNGGRYYMVITIIIIVLLCTRLTNASGTQSIKRVNMSSCGLAEAKKT